MVFNGIYVIAILLPICTLAVGLSSMYIAHRRRARAEFLGSTLRAAKLAKDCKAEQKMKAGASSQQVDADLRARAQLETSRPLITPNMVQLPAQRTPGNTEQAIGADGVPLSGAVSAFPNVQHIYSNELAMTSAAEDASLAEWAPQPSQMQSATAAEQVRWGYRR